MKYLKLLCFLFIFSLFFVIGCGFEIFGKLETYKRGYVELWAKRAPNAKESFVDAIHIEDSMHTLNIEKVPEFSIKLKDGTVVKSKNFTFDYLLNLPGARLIERNDLRDEQWKIKQGIATKETYCRKLIMFPGYKFWFNYKKELCELNFYRFINTSYEPIIGTTDGTVFYQLPVKVEKFEKIFGNGFVMISSHW